jgi:hypothetical protein
MTSALRASARRLGVLAAAPLLLGLAGFATATPAHAADTLTAGSLGCETDGYMPGKVNVLQFDCGVWASGGTGSYTYSWTGIANGSFFYGANTDDGWGMCDQGQRSTVLVTVHDSAGDTASVQTGFLCD